MKQMKIYIKYTGKLPIIQHSHNVSIGGKLLTKGEDNPTLIYI